MLTRGPGVGKTAFMAHLAAMHPDWLRYFTRRDSRDLPRPGDARTFLLAIGDAGQPAGAPGRPRRFLAVTLASRSGHAVRLRMDRWRAGQLSANARTGRRGVLPRREACTALPVQTLAAGRFR